MATMGTLRWPQLPPFLKDQLDQLTSRIVLALCLASAYPKGVYL